LRVFAFGFQRTVPSSVRRKLGASLVLELPWRESGRGSRRGAAIVVVLG
jgi:hypothetical protein